MNVPRIAYVPLERMDEAMRREMQRCAEYGTPRPESSAVRAHVPACFWSRSAYARYLVRRNAYPWRYRGRCWRRSHSERERMDSRPLHVDG